MEYTVFTAISRQAPINVLIVEDTRLGKGDEEAFKRMWGETAYFNSLCSNKRGLSALIRNETPISDITWENVIPGNFSKLCFKVKDKTVLIKCIYAPNEDSNPNDENNESTKFFKTIMNDTFS